MIKKIYNLDKINNLKFDKFYIFPKNNFSIFLSKKIKNNRNLFFVDNFKKNKNQKNLISEKQIDDNVKNVVFFTNPDVIQYFKNTKLKKIQKVVFHEKNKIKIDLDKNKINFKNLNQIFLYFNCDKGSNYFEYQKKLRGHNYSKFYKKIFGHLTLKKIKILELGAAFGASTASFLNYFKKSKIITTDINEDIFKYTSKRIKFIKLNYLNIKQVNNLKKRSKNFDIIIDDGDHSKTHILKNLNNFFSLVNTNGYYVIEDIGFSENFDYKNDDMKELSVLTILDNLKKKIKFKSNYIKYVDQEKLMNDISEIKIFKGAMKKNKKLVSIIAFIKKK